MSSSPGAGQIVATPEFWRLITGPRRWAEASAAVHALLIHLGPRWGVSNLFPQRRWRIRPSDVPGTLFCFGPTCTICLVKWQQVPDSFVSSDTQTVVHGHLLWQLIYLLTIFFGSSPLISTCTVSLWLDGRFLDKQI